MATNDRNRHTVRSPDRPRRPCRLVTAAPPSNSRDGFGDTATVGGEGVPPSGRVEFGRHATSDRYVTAPARRSQRPALTRWCGSTACIDAAFHNLDPSLGCGSVDAIQDRGESSVREASERLICGPIHAHPERVISSDALSGDGQRIDRRSRRSCICHFDECRRLLGRRAGPDEQICPGGSRSRGTLSRRFA